MNRVLEIRRSLGLSQEALSKELGVGQTAVSQYENDGCDPSVEVARKLIEFAKARGTEVTLEHIYGLQGA